MTPPRGFMQFEATQTQMRLPCERRGQLGPPLRPFAAAALRTWHPLHALHRLLVEDAEDALQLYEQCERRRETDRHRPAMH